MRDIVDNLYHVPIQDAIRLFGHPLNDPPWHNCEAFSQEEVLHTQIQEDATRPYGESRWVLKADPDEIRSWHIQRIAFLIKNSPYIQGVPQVSVWNSRIHQRLLINDGNHRFAAWLIMGRHAIPMRVYGYRSFVEELFAPMWLLRPYTNHIQVEPA